MPGLENIGITTVVATFQVIITTTTIKSVFAFVSIEAVIALATMQVVGVVVATQGVIVVCADAVSQGGECFSVKGIAVGLKGAIVTRFLCVLHEFLGKRCHVGVFAVSVAFSEQFAEIGEGFARFFCVYFVEEGSDTAVVQLQFAVLAHAEADGIEIGLEAGLEEQSVVEVIGKIGVGFFDGVEGVLCLCLGAVIEVGGIGAGEGVKNADFFMQSSFLFLIRIFNAKQRPDAGALNRTQFFELSRSERNGITFITTGLGKLLCRCCQYTFGGKAFVGTSPGAQELVAQRQLFFFGLRVGIGLQGSSNIG